jgi:hypothetical protein
VPPFLPFAWKITVPVSSGSVALSEDEGVFGGSVGVGLDGDSGSEEGVTVSKTVLVADGRTGGGTGVSEELS